MINILNKYKINRAEFFGVLKAGTMHVNFSQIKGRLGFNLAEVLLRYYWCRCSDYNSKLDC